MLPGKLAPSKSAGFLSFPKQDATPAQSADTASRITPPQAPPKEQPGVGEDVADEEDVQSEPSEDEEWADPEGDALRAKLEADVPPTRTVPQFLAHRDFAGRDRYSGVGGEIERLYLDIDAMVNALGVNAKHFKAFLQGHGEPAKEEGRSVKDLESEGDWCLVEVPELERMEDELEEELEEGRIQDVSKMKELCHAIRDEIVKRKSKTWVMLWVQDC